MDMTNITNIDGVVFIAPGLYAKTPEALEALLEQLGKSHAISQSIERKYVWYADSEEDCYEIYEAWHLHISHKTIIEAAGMTAKCAFYTSGKRSFYEIHLEKMRLFVQHLTTLNLKEWDRMIKRTSHLSSSELVQAIADFCNETSDYDPNAINFSDFVEELLHW